MFFTVKFLSIILKFSVLLICVQNSITKSSKEDIEVLSCLDILRIRDFSNAYTFSNLVCFNNNSRQTMKTFLY